MSPDDAYCLDRANQAGFDHLYRFLFRNESDYRAVLALRALEHQIDTLVEDTQETSVAMQQLDWWREEFVRLFNKEPRHPTTKAIVEHNVAAHIKEPAVVEWLGSVAHEIAEPGYVDDADFNELSLIRSGFIDRIIATRLDCDVIPTGTPAANWLNAFTLSRRRAMTTIALGRHLRAGYLPAPLKRFESAGIDVAHVLAPKSREATTTFVNTLLDEASTELKSVIDSDLPGTLEFAPLLATSSVLHRLAVIIQPNPEEILDGEIALTALGKILAARRAQRKARQRARH